MHILTIPLLLVHIFKNSVSYSFFYLVQICINKKIFFSCAIFSKAVALYFLSPFLIYLHFLWAISHSSGVYNLLSLSHTDELILFFLLSYIQIIVFLWWWVLLLLCILISWVCGRDSWLELRNIVLSVVPEQSATQGKQTPTSEEGYTTQRIGIGELF